MDRKAYKDRQGGSAKPTKRMEGTWRYAAATVGPVREKHGVARHESVQNHGELRCGLLSRRCEHTPKSQTSERPEARTESGLIRTQEATSATISIAHNDSPARPLPRPLCT
jgi:hypothetical protein